MKRLIFLLFVCAHCVYGQQKTTIKDSLFLAVLNSFIDELKLEEREYKLIRVQINSFEKHTKLTSNDTINEGEITGIRVAKGNDLTYSFVLELEVNSQTIDWRPITFYSVYRGIPVLIATGFEEFIETNRNRKELQRIIKKSSNPHLIGPSVVWIVNVHNEEMIIRKLK
jgi:hypothetical protein